MPHSRTFQLYGEAYSLIDDVSITCSFDGNEVYSGVVPTISSVPPEQVTSDQPLFSFIIPMDIFDIVKNTSIAVSGGTLYVSALGLNKAIFNDPTTFRKCITNLPKIKNNITVDGLLIDVLEQQDGWVYQVNDGETISIDWYIPEVDNNTAGRKGGSQAGEFVIGEKYIIKTIGDTDFTLLGSTDNNVGTVFTATGPGTGTGVAVFTSLL